jgi:N4-gp56 family major capsid protein
MANTVSIDALRREAWSREYIEDVIDGLPMFKKGFIGEGSDKIIQIKRDLQKEGGDTITFGLIGKLSGAGVTGDDELEGNEEALLSYSEQVAIDQIRNGVRSKGKLDLQKAVMPQVDAYRRELMKWHQEYLERQFFLKLGGVTNTTIVDTNGVVVGTRAAWSNTPDYIPDADEADGLGNRYRRAARSGAGDGTDDLAAGDTLTLDEISKCKTQAMLATPKLRPVPIPELGEGYVLFIHPLQARDLKASTDWKQAHREGNIRGANNPIFTGALGMWDGVLIVEHEYVPWLDVSVAGHSFRGAATGTDCAVDAARALFCGAQAGLMAQVTDKDGSFVVENFDYANKKGVAVSFMGGIQKAVFNSKEYGVIALDTAAAV